VTAADSKGRIVGDQAYSLLDSGKPVPLEIFKITSQTQLIDAMELFHSILLDCSITDPMSGKANIFQVEWS